MGLSRNISKTIAADLKLSNRQGDGIMDKNERFVLFKCACYMKNILSSAPISDDATGRFITWILKNDSRYLYEFLNEFMPDKNERKKTDEITRLMLDQDEYINYISRNIYKLKNTDLKKIEFFIDDLLEKRKNELDCKGLSSIEKKMSAFKKMFKLTDPEIEFCIFLLIVSLWEVVESYFIDYLKCHLIPNKRYLTSILQINTAELEKVRGGTLSRINIYEWERHSVMMNSDFIDFFLKSSNTLLSKNFFSKMNLKSIPLSMHVIDPEQTHHALDLLRKKPQKATNILLYGPPGTGKTNYASGLIRELGLTGYEIIKDNENNKSQNRRAAIIACYNMKQNDDKAVIVIDEADNLLNTQNAWTRIGETQDKGYLNNLLENEGIRTIWITNSIDAIDESVRRRFAYSIHFRDFNRRQRVQLWESISKKNRIRKFYDRKELEELAKKYKVNAGVIDLAIQKSVETYSISEKSQCKKAVIQSLDAYQTLIHQGYKPVSKNLIEDHYSLDGLNIRGDLKAMIQQLEKVDVSLRQNDRKRNINMNLLFWGPPGTGKSELARYIANHLDRELICRRASDIFDPYVGMTERNIKAMFSEAEHEDAVLVIDEADSLLCSRDRAVRSWELSFTNEFLTQMERFNGILVCTTNRLKDLDNASLRRFNHKIEFDYLTPQGNMIFYDLFLAPLCKETLDEKSKNILLSMANLAPGDFKVVRDRYSYAGKDDVSQIDLIAALQEECRAKQLMSPSMKIIGF